MKTNIEVTDRREADAIRTGLEDPAVRAFVVITGVLAPLTKRGRKRVMQYVTDKLDEEQETVEQRTIAIGNGPGTENPAR